MQNISVSMSVVNMLQRCAGVALTVWAGVVMLFGWAHLIIAALHNREGELGLGIDVTMLGFKLCLLAFLFGVFGAVLWINFELQIDRLAKEKVRRIPEIPVPNYRAVPPPTRRGERHRPRQSGGRRKAAA